MKVKQERFPIVMLSVEHEINICPTIVFKKADPWTKETGAYTRDNGMQLTTAMEDLQYTKWLDPDRVPCYVRDLKTKYILII